MPTYDDTNRGVAFKNENKKSENHPDYRGKGNFNGVDFEFAIWEKFGKAGQFFSFSFQEPYVKPEQKETVLTDISDEPIDLSEIPF